MNEWDENPMSDDEVIEAPEWGAGARADDADGMDDTGDDDVAASSEDEAPDVEPMALSDAGWEGPEDESEELPSWLEPALEALAFISTEAVSVSKARELLQRDDEEPLAIPTLRRAMRSLVAKWQAPGRDMARGIRLVELGGCIAFRTTPEVAPHLLRVQTQKPTRLSRAALETLAIVAYRQPLTRPQIDDIRGVDSSGAVKALLDKRLLRVLGKADEVGRPLLYGTTRTFLEFFNLASLRDLPTLKEFHELQGEGLAPAMPGEEEGGATTGRPAVVMDLFHPEKVGQLVSAETALESDEALDSLENALGQALATVRRVEDPNAPLPFGGPGISSRITTDPDADAAMADEEALGVDEDAAEPAPEYSRSAEDVEDAEDAVDEAPLDE